MKGALLAGDKPELVYPEAAQDLRQLGCSSTLEYVAQAATSVMQQTGLLPHINAGTMGLAEVWATSGLPLSGNSIMYDIEHIGLLS